MVTRSKRGTGRSSRVSTKFYHSRSTIATNKIEANRIADDLRVKGNYKKVSVVKRNLAADKKTKTPQTKGYWVRVNK